jgi:hypothetical protein
MFNVLNNSNEISPIQHFMSMDDGIELIVEAVPDSEYIILLKLMSINKQWRSIVSSDRFWKEKWLFLQSQHMSMFNIKELYWARYITFKYIVNCINKITDILREYNFYVEGIAVFGGSLLRMITSDVVYKIGSIETVSVVNHDIDIAQRFNDYSFQCSNILNNYLINKGATIKPLNIYGQNIDGLRINLPDTEVKLFGCTKLDLVNSHIDDQLNIIDFDVNSLQLDQHLNIKSILENKSSNNWFRLVENLLLYKDLQFKLKYKITNFIYASSQRQQKMIQQKWKIIN